MQDVGRLGIHGDSLATAYGPPARKASVREQDPFLIRAREPAEAARTRRRRPHPDHQDRIGRRETVGRGGAIGEEAALLERIGQIDLDGDSARQLEYGGGPVGVAQDARSRVEDAELAIDEDAAERGVGTRREGAIAMGHAVHRDEEIPLDTGHEEGDEASHLAQIARPPGTIAKARNAGEPFVAEPARGADAGLDMGLLHAVAEAEERAEIDRRRERRKLELERERRTYDAGILPGIDLEREERGPKRILRLDPQRLRRLARPLQRHEMIPDAAPGKPGGMDEQRRPALEIGQQIGPRLAVGGIVRRMRRLVDGIDGHGPQCNVGLAMSGNELLLAHIDRPLSLPHEERVGLLGGKGDGLMRMAGELGLPVPPAFILTTKACALHRAGGWTAELEQALCEGIASLEQQTGRRFGDAADAMPLLVSVRSGAPLSMPGMLDTILNVGLDDAAIAFLARSNPRLADECRDRLSAAFHASVGHAPPPDVRFQLRDAVEAVFRSANAARARAYRRHEGLEGEGLTAVNVQAMVFGNQDERSATGVYFTRDPATGEARPYGDLLFQAQGEDVVSGRYATEPLAELGRRMPDVARSLFAIGRRLERAYRDLCEIEFTIESGRLWLLQVRVGKRSARAALRIATALALDPEFPLDRREAALRTRALLLDPPQIATIASGARRAGDPAEPLAVSPIARGLGASPGIASGEIATTTARALVRAGAGHAVLLVRPETSPDDVEGMAVARGLLTASGGLASHAAVVARGWGVPAVVGLAALGIDDEGIEIAGRRFAVGSWISIDGSTGDVYADDVEIARHVVPEAERLIAWASELGLELVGERAPAAADSPAHEVAAHTDPMVEVRAEVGTLDSVQSFDALADSIVRALSIKGSATAELLAPILSADVPTAAPADAPALASALDALVMAGDVSAARPLGFRLTDAGRLRAQALLASDQAALGIDIARAALEAFQPFDVRIKEAVTDWQLRLEGAERVPNDHTNVRWDAAVVERLAGACNDATSWFADVAVRLPRLLRYAERLTAAVDRICEGDGRFVASPRVDSLHGVWFELHEDLIRLADSSRAEELAAGRAG